MTWCWFALAPTRPEGAVATAELRTLDGTPAGYAAAWASGNDQPQGALRIDADAIDPDGEPATVSLVLPPSGVSLLFDDPAVSGALRRVLLGERATVLSTLLVDESHFGGALTGVRDGHERLLADDPFARLFPARLLRFGAGLLGSTPGLPGPVIARYGGGEPWPWSRFAGG